MPKKIAETVSEGVYYLSHHTAGGRLRFQTNSPYLAIKCVEPSGGTMGHMPFSGSHGFGLFEGERFCGGYIPSVEQAVGNTNGEFAFDGVKIFDGKVHDFTLFFPLYNGVKRLYIGIKKGSDLLPAKKYTYQKPVVFYGSSITQGGCASTPGNDYIGLLSKRLDTDVVNLGFSGNAKGEQTMCDYLASLDASVFVLDYDHNAPNVEHLKNTHYNLYQTIRKKHPTTPIIMMTRPDFYENADCVERRKVVYSTYQKAKKEWDRLVSFIDGETLFEKIGRNVCTVDGCHPTNAGFLGMANTIYPILKKVLKKYAK